MMFEGMMERLSKWIFLGGGQWIRVLCNEAGSLERRLVGRL